MVRDTEHYPDDEFLLIAKVYAHSAAKIAQVEHPTDPLSHLPAISMLAGGGREKELPNIGQDLGKAYGAASAGGRRTLHPGHQHPHREQQFRYLPDMPKLQVAKPETPLQVLDDLVYDVSDFVTARSPSGDRAKPHLAGWRGSETARHPSGRGDSYGQALDGVLN